MVFVNNDALRPLLQSRYEIDTLRRVREVLAKHQTLRFPVLSTGLFSASPANLRSKGTGYRNAWVRDNIHIAHAHWVTGDARTAVRNVAALCEFFTRHRSRFLAVIREPALARVSRNRPHARFDGTTLAELPENWAHDQNDALGYFLWLYAKLAAVGALEPESDHLETLALFPEYLHAIRYWEDRDSGHWEEPPRKVSASSIGAVLAGLEAMSRWLDGDSNTAKDLRRRVTTGRMSELISRGSAALQAILPWESREFQDGSPGRQHDAALLFLIYPLRIVSAHHSEQIVRNVVDHLRGEYGIKRYLRDSFYCTNYERNLQYRHLARDFSDDIAFRDAFFVEGGESQWCLFDPIVSIYFGLRFRNTNRDDDLMKQTEYLNRSLGQVTGNDGRYGAFRCPELYYFEDGRLQTSRSTPLLWTQANLWMALHQMEENVRLGTR